ncbi:MAG: hypothetical protein WA892_07935 [Ornithinimicrobium sp.]
MVDDTFAVGVKINTSDQLEGGLTEDEALVVVSLLGQEAVDLIDLSGGTYFPGAPSSSDRRTRGPYFLDFAQRARAITDIPLMVTGGFKTHHEAAQAVVTERADLVGLARTMVLNPATPTTWLDATREDQRFPRFESPPPGGITAWFTMRLTALAAHNEVDFDPTPGRGDRGIRVSCASRVARWSQTFGPPATVTPRAAAVSSWVTGFPSSIWTDILEET